MKETKQKLFAAMSGGVDSAVTALLMQKEGFEVEGATMRLFHPQTDIKLAERACGTQQDIDDAKAVCDILGIAHHVLDFSADFKEKVIQNFIDAYAKGLTPNPCVVCNRHLKFDRFLETAIENGAQYMATGHYARVEKQGDRYLLKKAKDETKDQTYVLYALTQDQLQKIRFPLGDYRKTEVRELAESYGFRSAQKRESQDICFVPDGDYASFIERFSGKTFPHGNFVNAAGDVLGEHKGIIHYTVGQRRGLGLALPRPMYVIGKDAKQNLVTLGYNDDLFSRDLTVRDIRLTAADALEHPERLEVKIRYAHKAQPAMVEQVGTDEIHILFDEPQRAATSGQAAVFYDGDTVVGGGTIV